MARRDRSSGIVCLVAASVLASAHWQAVVGQGQPLQLYIGLPAVRPEDTGRDACGELYLNADGEYHAAFGWQYGGVQEPFYGAFAECYSGDVEVCAVVLDFTDTHDPGSARLDAYVWSDDAGRPGNVMCVVIGVDPGPIAWWPYVSRHRIELDPGCCVSGSWWVGYWPDWPGQGARWYTTADMSEPGGCPLTNIAPGVGYPTGWQNVSIVWGPHTALGIGAEVVPCGATAVRRSTWGAVKAALGGGH